MQIPRLDKIVLNMGVGEAVSDSKKVRAAAADLGQIVGQIRRIAVVIWQHAAFLKPMNALLLRRRQRR